jgi:hypothetical protein
MRPAFGPPRQAIEAAGIFSVLRARHLKKPTLFLLGFWLCGAHLVTGAE